MEKGQSEVTDKIRLAIKNKLVELNCFVDNELPEYIMILVANKRSKAHIEKDLALFLGNDTSDFTNWLWDLLINLKYDSKMSASTSAKKDFQDIRRKDINVIDDESDVLDYDPDEQDRDCLNQEDITESMSISKAVDAPEKSVIKSEQLDIKKREFGANENSQNREQDKRKSNPRSEKLFTGQQFSRTFPCSAVIPIKRTTEYADEYDPAKPNFGSSVSSVVCVTPRQYVGAAAALQANKLLLRAVDDATKSVLDGKSISDFYKPTPIEVLASNSRKPKPGKAFNKNDSNHDFQIRSKSKSSMNLDFHRSINLTDVDMAVDILMDEDIDSETYSSERNRTICLKTVPLVDTDMEELQVMNADVSQNVSSYTEECPKSPHFFVTLEGINLNPLKRKFNDNSSVESAEEEEVMSSDEVPETVPEKRIKVSERCKYWPACKNSDHCAYHHPTKPCKCFPDCKFGDKCLYIHPNCKFDALCSRKDCPYTHASKRNLQLSTIPIKMVPVKSPKIKTVCKFYPKCTSKQCAFVHPKLCRYGIACRSPNCSYSHFHVPPRKQMKWQANAS